MNYKIEEIIQAIKTARKDRRLSQRALSAKAGIPQSHISKIENGSVDITLSTLIELARALDLEVMLVPRKLIPAMQSIIRSSNPDWVNVQESRAAWNELKQIEKILKDMRAVPEAVKDIQRLQNTAQELRNVLVPPRYLDQLREVSETLRAFREGPSALKEISQTAKALQGLRNQIIHGIPKTPSIPMPAYSLDVDDV